MKYLQGSEGIFDLRKFSSMNFCIDEFGNIDLDVELINNNDCKNVVDFFSYEIIEDLAKELHIDLKSVKLSREFSLMDIIVYDLNERLAIFIQSDERIFNIEKNIKTCLISLNTSAKY